MRSPAIPGYSYGPFVHETYELIFVVSSLYLHKKWMPRKVKILIEFRIVAQAKIGKNKRKIRKENMTVFSLLLLLLCLSSTLSVHLLWNIIFVFFGWNCDSWSVVRGTFITCRLWNSSFVLVLYKENSFWPYPEYTFIYYDDLMDCLWTNDSKVWESKPTDPVSFIKCY